MEEINVIEQKMCDDIVLPKCYGEIPTDYLSSVSHDFGCYRCLIYESCYVASSRKQQHKE